MPKQRRRAQGTGGIYESFVRGNFRYTEGYLPAGTPIPGTDDVLDKRIFKRSKLRQKQGGEDEVRQLLAEALAELGDSMAAAEIAADPVNYLVWDAIVDWYRHLLTLKKPGKSTADKLLGQARVQIKPHIGDIPLVEADAATIMKLLRQVAPNLSAGYLSDIKSILSRAMDWAIENDEAPFTGPNTAATIKHLPEAGHKPKDRDNFFLTQEQVDRIMLKTVGTREHALAAVGIYCGLRPGELRALKWDDIQWEKRRIYVVWWARFDGDGDTKTKASRRYVPMSDDVIDALRYHEEHFAIDGCEYVFPREDGEQLDSDGIAWRVGKAYRAGGLMDEEDVYRMRHTFCSFLYDAGFEKRDIAELMGHDNEITFQKVYAHRLDPEATSDAVAEKMNNLFSKRRKVA